MHIFLVDHIDLAGISCPIIALTFEVEAFTDEMESAFKDDYEIIKVSTLEVLVYEQIKEQTGSPFVPWDIFESGRKAFTKDFAKELAQELTR